MNPKINLLLKVFSTELDKIDQPEKGLIFLKNAISNTLREYHYCVNKSLNLPAQHYSQELTEIYEQMEKFELELIEQLLVGLEYVRKR